MSGGLILALDGSAPRFSLALASAGGDPIAERILEQTKASKTLFGALDELLRDCGVERRELGTIVATRGPGSFTGLRVALSAAWGLHQSLEIPAGAVGSLAALAECMPEAFDDGLMAIDALRSEWYTQRFTGTPRAAVGHPSLQTASEIIGLAPVVVGFGVGSLGTSIVEPDSLAAAAIRRFLREGRQSNPALLTQPLYLREASVSRPRTAAPA